MSWRGDFALGSTVHLYFTTVNSSGVPTQLTGSPLAVARKGSTVTPSSDISVTVDWNGITGLNQVSIDTTGYTAFFAGAGDYCIALTAGTVGTASVVGYVLGTFSLESRSALRPTTAARTLDVSTGGEAGVDWANVGSPTTTLALSGTTVKTATDVETDTADLQGRVPAALVSGRMDASVGAMAANTLTASALATDAVTEIATAVWAFTTRTLTSFSTLVADIWAYASRTLTAITSVTVVTPVGESGDLTLTRADDHYLADGRAAVISRTGWPDLTGATAITMTARSRTTDSVWFAISDLLASRVVGPGSQTLVFEPTKALTAGITPGVGTGKYDIQATLASGHIVTLQAGTPGAQTLVNVIEDQTR